VTQVLVVDDHIEMARVIADHLEDLGVQCKLLDSGAAAVVSFDVAIPDLVITDLRMAEVDGMDVLDAAHRADPDLPVIIMTAFGGIDSAIEAMRRGAWHYVTKPVRMEELRLHAERALRERRLRRETHALRAAHRDALHALIGRSAPMRKLYDLIDRIAPSPSPVLIRGESGSGKELVARAIHAGGTRREAPFVAVNCTALPESLLESELFGHARGAFTGAAAARSGLFVEASGGTLFLDEIGDMAPPLQAKLLRVVQLGEVRPVGADESRRVDVRLIAATHQDLEKKLEEGTFRNDLYYRLNVVPLHVPPLRDRNEDIPLLVEHFLACSRERNPHAIVARLAPALLSALSAHPWPGNVRELENIIERLVVVGTKVELDVADLQEIAPALVTGDRFAIPRDRMPTLRQLEDEYMTWVLGRCEGNKTRAAEVLGVDVSTIHRRTRGREPG
jgi:two-component system response regulator HydG